MRAVFVILLLTLEIVSNLAETTTKCDSTNVYKPFPPDPEGGTGGGTKEEGAVGDESDEEKYYYICIGETGDPIKKTCPSYLDFDANLLGCAYQPADPETPAPTECKAVGDKKPDLSPGACNKCFICEDTTEGFPDVSDDCKDADGTQLYFNKFLNTFIETEWDCAKNDADRPDCSKDKAIYGTKNIIDPKSCETYYRCDGSIRVKEKCPSGYLFDTVSQVCRFAKEAKCELTETPTTGLGVKDICKGKTSSFVADPNYCKGYYYCIDEKTPYWGYCADGKYFNNGYCSSTRPNTCRCEDVEFDETTDVVYFEHPNKSKFYVCEKGKFGVEKSCPAGYVFDMEEESCVGGR